MKHPINIVPGEIVIFDIFGDPVGLEIRRHLTIKTAYELIDLLREAEEIVEEHVSYPSDLHRIFRACPIKTITKRYRIR